MPDDYEKLLRYIVEKPLMASDSRESEIDATANRDVGAEIAGVAEERRKDADRLASYFVEGLRRAVAGGGHVDVEDSDPTGNGIADAFAQFLVTTNLATSESTETSDGHYKYHFDVDLGKLRDIAGRAGIQL